MPFADGTRWCATRGCMLPVQSGSEMCELHYRVDRDRAAAVLGLTRAELDERLTWDDSLRMLFGRRGRTAPLRALENWQDHETRSP